MKKRIFTIVLAALLCVSASACGNRQWYDTTYRFDYAIIKLPDGTCVEGEVQSWTDYDDGDQIQVKIDGKTYLVHSSNICLISE